MANNEHTKEPVVIERIFNDVCRNCRGSGKRDNRTCPVCKGNGIVKITKDIYIYVEPIEK